MKTKFFATAGMICMLACCCTFDVSAQTIVKGVVRDAMSNQPLPFVSIVFQGGKGGVTSNEDGSYSIQTNNLKLNTLVFTFAGYKKFSVSFTPGIEQTIPVLLESGTALKDVKIKTKRGRYSNKNNPAVELIDLVIANKNKNRITSYNYVQYREYEKITLSLSNKPEKIANNRLFRKYQFMIDNVDTTKVEGKSLLPVYMEEKLSETYLRKDPSEKKSVVLAEKKVNYGEFFDANGISNYLNALYADINIYDNNVSILATQFLSPIADMAPTFYRFYIRDTVEEDGIKLIKLNFMPKNTADLLFRGVMYVTLDGNYGVQKIDLSVSKKANLNWTKELKISLGFERSALDGRYHLIKSTMLSEFAIQQNSSGGLLGERTVSLKDFIINQPAPDSVYTAPDEYVKVVPGSESDSFWLANRFEKLSAVEAKVYSNIDSLRKMKSFRTTMQVGLLIFSGWVKVGKFEIGNTNTFYSFNPVEGFRPRFGGRSTPEFSKHWYIEAFTAYGLRDKKWKYNVGLSYAFNGKSIFTYPNNYIKFTRAVDTKIPGQELVFANEDNFFLSFKRGDNDKLLYNNSYKVDYVREFNKYFTFKGTFEYLKQSPGGSIYYEKQVGANLYDSINNLTTSEFSAELRWAPHEQFYQGKNFRRAIPNKFPILKLRYEKGVKGLFGGEYNYDRILFALNKRCYLSQLGYADLFIEASNTFGQVPHPLLNIHRANQSFAYQLTNYNLMNFMEFVSDHSVAATLDFYFNGFFFNKVPLLKRLKLREVASFRVLYGGLRDENDPDKNNSLYRFPKDKDAPYVPITYALGSEPYMELSIGLANIFKIVRVDLVKRLSYLNHPNVAEWGIRTRIRVEF